MRTKVAAILFIILLAFVFATSFHIFNKILINTDPLLSGTAMAAFLGAFFAFLFVRIGDFLKAYSDRMTKSHSTLVKLEHLLNNLLGKLDDNIFMIETFENHYKNYENSNDKLFVWGNRLKPVDQIGDLITSVANIDLTNELFILDVHLRKLNESMETLNSSYEESKNALISKNIGPSNYKFNIQNTRKDLIEIKKFVQSQINECTDTLSSVRVLAKNRPLIGSLIRIMPGYKYNSNFEADRQLEKEKLLKEMGSIKRQGRERINDILNKRNNDS